MLCVKVRAVLFRVDTELRNIMWDPYVFVYFMEIRLPGLLFPTSLFTIDSSEKEKKCVYACVHTRAKREVTIFVSQSL